MFQNRKVKSGRISGRNWTLPKIRYIPNLGSVMESDVRQGQMSMESKCQIVTAEIREGLSPLKAASRLTCRMVDLKCATVLTW